MNLRQLLESNGASPLAIAWRCDQDPARRDYLAGAEAMREACIEVVRGWWGKAGRIAGYRWPGHPHHLECAMRALPVGGGAAGGDGGSNPAPADAQGPGQCGDRGPVRRGDPAGEQVGDGTGR